MKEGFRVYLVDLQNAEYGENRNWIETWIHGMCSRKAKAFSSKTFSRMSGKDVTLSAPCGSSRIFNAFFPFLSGLTAFSARIKWDSFAIDACQTILTLERQARIRDNFTWYILMRSHTAGYFNHRSPGHGVIARTPKELIKTARLSAH